eukprot:scpid78611/ scgid28946/ 
MEGGVSCPTHHAARGCTQHHPTCSCCFNERPRILRQLTAGVHKQRHSIFEQGNENRVHIKVQCVVNESRPCQKDETQPFTHTSRHTPSTMNESKSCQEDETLLYSIYA